MAKSRENRGSAVVWFRRDLRVMDNPALDYAIREGYEVIPIYVESNQNAQHWQPGAASRWWCYQSLKSLADSLQQQNLTLRFFYADPKQIIRKIIKQTGATLICWNTLYEPAAQALECDLIQILKGIDIQRFDSHLLFTPGTVLNKQGDPYRVFTPFWKTARQQLEVSGVNLTKTKRYKRTAVERITLKGECKLDGLGLLDSHLWHKKLEQHWSPGEMNAQKRLRHFIKKYVSSYEVDRDIPSIEGTSKLSPHLHFGEITPAQIYYQLQQADYKPGIQNNIERFISELGWREFAHHVLWHFPATCDQAMNQTFKRFWPNKANQRLLVAWQKGQTGIPLVDAGMRQLWETGWMHGRVRMVVGSFLTKNLGIHWLQGARWFWDTLVDADLANNTMGWQWVAGCGVDAAPYYRIFNPETQAKRFDPSNDYLQHWLPKGGHLSGSPLVDLKESRAKALLRYKKL